MEQKNLDVFSGFDKNKAILENFRTKYKAGFVALHPFYKTVFAEEYNYLARLNETYHLIETVTWQEVAKDMGLGDLKLLAKGLLELDRSFARELSDYLDNKKYLPPFIAEDCIPEKIIVPLLSALIDESETPVICEASRNPFSTATQALSITEASLFESASNLLHHRVIVCQSPNLALFVPDFDCPYTLLLGGTELIKSLVTKSGLEGFYISENTRADWWNQ